MCVWGGNRCEADWFIIPMFLIQDVFAMHLKYKEDPAICPCNGRKGLLA